MFKRNTILPLVAAFSLASLIGQVARAGEQCCDRCGCHAHCHKVCKLVLTCEAIDMPTYQCAPEDVFCPDKGQVCHTQYRCDTIYHLHKHCERTGDCQTCTECGGCQHQSCEVCTTTCTCHTKSGCKTLHGAKPTGCMVEQCVQRPTGVCKKQVPVLKWVTICVCDDCHCSSK
jgi:hypothetical protein